MSRQQRATEADGLEERPPKASKREQDLRQRERETAQREQRIADREARQEERERHLRETLSHLSRLGYFEQDYRNSSAIPNRLWEELGYSAEEMRGDAWLEAVHPEDRARITKRFRDHMNTDRSFDQSEFRIRAADGGYRWILAKVIVTERDADGAPLRYLGADSDITRLKQTEEQLRNAKHEADLRAQEAETLRQAGAAIASTLDRNEAVRLVMDQAGLVVPYETATVQVLEDGMLRVIGVSGSPELEEDSRIDPEEVQPYKRLLAEAAPILDSCSADGVPDCPRFRDGRSSSWIGVPLENRDRIVGILTLSKADGRRFEQRHLRLASAFADYVGIAIENARLFEEARTLAITDDLTGLPTRRWFLPHARHQVEQARRYGEPISVLAVDLDRFKQVNDRYGHQTGDHVLREVALSLQRRLRAVDALCRFGGEEFLALLPRTAEEQAYVVADRLRKAVAASRIEDFNEAVTVSLGVAGASTLRPERYDLDLLIRRADKALYSAKDAGRDTVHASSGLGRRRR